MHDDPNPPRPLRNAGGSVNGWLVAILLIAVGALYMQMSGLWPGALLNPNADARPVTPRGDLADDEKSTIELFQTASKSVVHIKTSAAERRQRMNPLEAPQGSGSGFVWDKNGYIVTNSHVLRGASAVRVILSDSSSYPARIVGTNRANDLAVVKIDAPAGKLQPISLGSSSDLQVGQKVFAIGSPFSLDQSLTTGVVSGLGRQIQSDSGTVINDVIQVNAAINPGNSGGPLLDSAGRLIGVNTAIVSPTGAFSGIGFAIPADTVNAIAPSIIRSGTTTPPVLGVTLYPDETVAMLRRGNILNSEGVLVRDVWEGSAAEVAGIQSTRQTADGRIIVGDLIVAIGDKTVQDVKSYLTIMSSHRAGEVVTVTVIRGNSRLRIDVMLQQRPDGDEP